MGYKYYQAGIPTLPTSASQAWLNDFDAQLSYQWENSTDIYTIQEESSFGSGSYIDVRVRINRGINSYTGERLGDDFKTILFKDRYHNIDVGLKYYFDGSYWLTSNTEELKNLGCSVLVRRCNNVLKWMSGSCILEEHVAIEYSFKNPRLDTPESDAVTPQAYLRAYCQKNSKTTTITPNQRFLFGSPDNWTPFRVLAVRNFLNQETEDNTTSRLMSLEIQEYQGKSDNDDLINGIADRYAYVVSGSSSAVNNVVVEPANGYVLEGATQIFESRLYSGSTILSGSFVFSVSGSMVPTDHYTFSSLTGNTFSVKNNEMYLDYPLNILCSGSSGSRIFPVSLRGAW